jgi:hypothetical protein
MALTFLTNINGNFQSACSILMGKSIKLFYIIVIIFMIITFLGQICNAIMCNPSNYREGSKFERNLNTVFNRLVQATSQTGFNTSEYGQCPDQIYMASYNVEETQQPTSTTVVHKKQTLPSTKLWECRWWYNLVG